MVWVAVSAPILALIFGKPLFGSWPVQPMEPNLRGARLGRVVSKLANSPGVPQSQVSFEGLGFWALGLGSLWKMSRIISKLWGLWLMIGGPWHPVHGHVASRPSLTAVLRNATS